MAAVKPQKNTKRQSIVKSEDENDASDSDKEDADVSSAPTTPKGKRKLQGRKTNKILQMQTKIISDSESDTGGFTKYMTTQLNSEK